MQSLFWFDANKRKEKIVLTFSNKRAGTKNGDANLLSGSECLFEMISVLVSEAPVQKRHFLIDVAGKSAILRMKMLANSFAGFSNQQECVMAEMVKTERAQQ